jgi:ubiquinone/menaquinone biosynthesis C-methylase UbiE
MSLQKFLKKGYNKAKGILGENNDDKRRSIVQFKKDIWQTEEISRAFVKGSDANMVMAADMMDKEVNEFFLSHCSLEDNVLDIGCGHGVVSEFLAEKGIHVTAIDISEKLLNELGNRISGRNLPIEIKQGDAYHIPAADEVFDIVVARMFLPHFPDWHVVLKEMTRVTKKGGKLLVHFSSKENTDLGKRLALNDCVFGTSPNPNDPWTFYAETDAEELGKVSKNTGLEVIARTPVSFFLHNRLLGYQLGTERYNSYMQKVQEFLKDEKVREFAIWFDKEIIANCTPDFSHFSIITFKKL